jgi:DNA-binding transcriptional ArsR family regulator
MNDPQTTLMPPELLCQAADCLKVMAHPARLRMVDILMQSELPVGKIAELCNLSPHQACEHLRLLKGHGLLDSDRRGREVYYRIVSPQLPALLKCIRQACGVCHGAK